LLVTDRVSKATERSLKTGVGYSSPAGLKFWRAASRLALAECECPECEAAPEERCFDASRMWGRVDRGTYELHEERLLLGARRVGLPR
jgi:hypothetical protein